MSFPLRSLAFESSEVRDGAAPPVGTAVLKIVQLHVIGIGKATGGAAPPPATRTLGKDKNRSKPVRGTHRLAVIQDSLGLVGAIGVAAPALAVAAVRRGLDALEDGGGGAGALSAPARCSAHAHASAARSRPPRGAPRARAAPSPAATRGAADPRRSVPRPAGTAPLKAASAAAVGDRPALAGEPEERPAASPPLPRGEAEGLAPSVLQQHVSPCRTTLPVTCSAVLLPAAGRGASTAVPGGEGFPSSGRQNLPDAPGQGARPATARLAGSRSEVPVEPRRADGVKSAPPSQGGERGRQPPARAAPPR